MTDLRIDIDGDDLRRFIEGLYADLAPSEIDVLDEDDIDLAGEPEDCGL